MKIAIITLLLDRNYGGGLLQAYALQTVLEKMGNDVEILQTKHPWFNASIFIVFLIYCKRILLKLFKNHREIIFKEIKGKKEYPVIVQHTTSFINKYLHIRKIRNFKEIKPQDYDAFVVGSDQVWRRKYFITKYSKLIDAYLYFAKDWNVLKISYAASFGTDEARELFNSKENQQIKEALKSFKGVSVREDTGIDICANYFKIIATHVLDPTFLLSKDDYINLIRAGKTEKSKGNLLFYILDATKYKTEAVNRIADKLGLVPFGIVAPMDDFNLPLEERIQNSPEQFLRSFEEAQFIVCDSFHACVFSIIFNKPFIAIGNKARGLTRFTSLLKLFNLNDRLIFPEHKIDNSLIFKKINWIEINNKLKILKQESIDFLVSNLRMEFDG